MNRRRGRPDWRRVKTLRSYTIDEAARVLGVHRNTVRHWIKSGLPTIDDKRPILIVGSDLAEFRARRREGRRQRCGPGQIFCVKCRKPKEPAGRMADYVPSTPAAGALVGLCPDCGTLMHRRVSIARLDIVKSQLEVQCTQPQPRIEDTESPRVNCHFGREA
jgi:hypothetical protein